MDYDRKTLNRVHYGVEKLYHEVGETFTYFPLNWEIVTVKSEPQDTTFCEMCIFYETGRVCQHLECMSHEREDETNVHYKRLNETL